MRSRRSSTRTLTATAALALGLALTGPAAATPGTIFWSNGWQNGQGYPGTVNRLELGGANTVLVQDLETVGDVELDGTSGTLYYNTWARPTNCCLGHPGEGIFSVPAAGGPASLVTSASNSITGFPSGLHGLALDPSSQTIYFTRGVSYVDFATGAEVSRVGYDGTGYQQLHGQDGWFVSGVDVDVANALVYFGSPGVIINGPISGAINTVSTSGFSPATVLPHEDGLGRAIAFDAASGTIFFTAWTIFDPANGGQIWRVQSDGSGLEQLPIPGLTGVPDIEIDPASQRIWYTNFHAGTVESANFDGSGVTIEADGLDYPMGLALSLVADSDGDGVLDDDDLCDDTSIPEGISSSSLNPNHFALTNADGDFDTVSRGKGNGPGRSYSIEDTRGCSCTQIIAASGKGKGHLKHGCSISAMDEWIAGLPN